MKAISIRQPWAWAIIHAGKDIENRSRHTNYRGPILIHASKTFDGAGYRAINEKFPEIEMPFWNGWTNEFDMGGVIGAARLIASVSLNSSKWWQGPVGYVLRDPKPLEFHPCNGKLGLFDIQLPEGIAA